MRKMKTPIIDFITEYNKSGTARLHMPGHKGLAFGDSLGVEKYDITEIKGADNLYAPEGIIAESEANASMLFGCQTVYSAEGSSQCIKSMLYMAMLKWKESHKNERPKVLAARNAHKAFVHAAALMDLDVVWLYPEDGTGSICSCPIGREQLEHELQKEADYMAVYVTSPDYLGGVLDLKALSETAHAHNVPFLVDSAHGAYLRFLDHKKYPLLDNPVALGADLACTSAHKTLPALTGAAYLHMNKAFEKVFDPKRAMEIFGSSSPSYLIMCSLDEVNKKLDGGYAGEIKDYCEKVEALKEELKKAGIPEVSMEPLKITVKAEADTNGEKLAEEFRKNGIECEFADEDYVVFMLTPANGSEILEKLKELLFKYAKNKKDTVVKDKRAGQPRPEIRMSIREALMSPAKRVSAKEAVGKVCASYTLSCPPAIPLIMPGEVVYEGLDFDGEIDVVAE